MKNIDFVLGCACIPFVHEIRVNFLKTVEKGGKVFVENLWKYLLFGSEE